MSEGQGYLKFIRRQASASRITKIWTVQNDGGQVVGHVTWHAQWRKYIFSPREKFIFDQLCLREIATFIEKETADHKAARKKA